jgi:hypothetical protein
MGEPTVPVIWTPEGFTPEAGVIGSEDTGERFPLNPAGKYRFTGAVYRPAATSGGRRFSMTD